MGGVGVKRIRSPRVEGGMSMKLFFWGRKLKKYNGFIGGKKVTVGQGQTLEAPREDAERLLKDYPIEFEPVPEMAGQKGSAKNG